MKPSKDELAGAVDLFGALTRDELRRAFEDLAARGGTPFDPDALDDQLDTALRDYYLVRVDRDGTDLIAPGPAALPTLPKNGEDLPHLLSVDGRSIDRETLDRAVEARLRADAARAVDAGDEKRVRQLLDVCYEVDAWGHADTAGIRDRLDAALE